MEKNENELLIVLKKTMINEEAIEGLLNIKYRHVGVTGNVLDMNKLSATSKCNLRCADRNLIG